MSVTRCIYSRGGGSSACNKHFSSHHSTSHKTHGTIYRVDLKTCVIESNIRRRSGSWGGNLPRMLGSTFCNLRCFRFPRLVFPVTNSGPVFPVACSGRAFEAVAGFRGCASGGELIKPVQWPLTLNQPTTNRLYAGW